MTPELSALGAKQRGASFAQLEPALKEVARTLALAVGSRARAVLVTGSFGRDEGALVATPGGQFIPHNDVDLVLVVDGGAKAVRRPVAQLSHAASQRLGWEVEAWPVDAMDLVQPPRTLFWLDVALGGHKVVWGSTRGLQLDTMRASEVPLDEAGRLLANRATGIAISRLSGLRNDLASAIRHAHKAVLACGDATLLLTGRYRGRLLERCALLRASADVDRELALKFEEALRYRVRPDLWRAPGEPTAWIEETYQAVAKWHLALEARRRGTPQDAAGYANFPGALYSLSDAGRLPRAIHRLVWSTPLHKAPASLHPRERVARASIALAYGLHKQSAREAACRVLGVQSRSTDEQLHHALVGLRAKGG